MVTNNHYRWDFIGLSTDVKPTSENSEKVVNGSTFYCSDTSKLYVYYKGTWYEKVVEGGGTSYTAGNGIDISNNEISVDTDTIQPKLTAGTNISIDTNNVISAEGGGPAVVQNIGTSTTDVMSQKAVTDVLFYNNAKYKVQIGNGADSSSGGTASSIAIGSGKAKSSDTIAIGSNASSLGGDAISLGRESSCTASTANSVAIGRLSSVTAYNAVAVGCHATATQQGQFDISTGNVTWGYNNSGYRLLTGLYDGQSAHDAVTVEQVNATIDAINTALSTSIPHIGA